MRILELQRSSAEEAELLEATAAAHGNWVYAAAPLMDRLWLMRSAWAPGLRYVGGMACDHIGGGGAPAPSLPVGGAGLRLEDALAGCLAEAVERTAQVEHSGDVILSAAPGDVSAPDQVGELIALLAARDPAAIRGTIDWVRARHCATGAEALVPADWCLRRSRAAALALPGGALSTGCAAAVTPGEALTRGLTELAERDAAALWWLGGMPAATLHPGSAEAAAAARMTGELRLGAATGRATMILDITGDLAIPAMAALSYDRRGAGLAIGLAAHPSAARATAGALLELGQMELGLQLATDKRDQAGEAALAAEDRRHLARAAIAIDDLAPLAAPLAPRVHQPAPTDGDATDRATAFLTRHGIDAWAIDLTRPGRGLAVVKVIAPRLQPMPGEIVTARLASIRRTPAPPAALM